MSKIALNIKDIQSKLEIAARHNSGKIHIFTSGDNWVLKKEGAKKVSRIFSTRAEAISQATIQFKNSGKVLVVHRNDGSVEDKITIE